MGGEIRRAQSLQRRTHHANVPSVYHTNPQLGSWVVEQRTHYRLRREGKQSSMKNERIRELEAIGFVWNIYDDIWDQMMAELAGYVERAGGINKIHHRDDLFGNWFTRQRALKRLRKRGKKCSLTDERIAQLDKYGFHWDVREKAWSDMFKDLEEYKEKHGTTKVKIEDNPVLYRWCTRQRQLNALVDESGISMLKPERKQRLDGIKFDFYRRKGSQRESKIEWKMMHEIVGILEDLGLEWDSLDQVFGKLKFRPDGVIIVPID